MREAIASAPGKINLRLKVGEQQPDGYHPLVTVFEAVSMREYVVVRTRRAPGISLRDIVCKPGGGIDREQSAIMRAIPQEENLTYRAAELLRPLASAQGWGSTSAGVSLTVYKSLPIAGGMAGGSADAAATLVALNEMWELGLSMDQLLMLGARLGADVPACLLGGLSLGTGRGDKLERLDWQREDWWALAVNAQGLSTPDVFRQFDRMGGGSQSLSAEVYAEDLASLSNDLTEAALALRPELQAIGERGVELGASEWAVSGSGPTIAFRCDSESIAVVVANAMTTVQGVRMTAVAHGPVCGAQIESGLPVQLVRISAT